MMSLKDLDRRLAELEDVNAHNELRVLACSFALASLPGDAFRGTLEQIMQLYLAIGQRVSVGGLSFRDDCLRSGCDLAFEAAVSHALPELAEVTKRYI